MKGCKSTIWAGLLAALLTGTTVADDHARAREWAESGEILPLATLLERLPVSGEGHLLEVELEVEHGRPIYEIEWLAADGTVHEFEFDARDGRLLEEDREARRD